MTVEEWMVAAANQADRLNETDEYVQKLAEKVKTQADELREQVRYSWFQLGQGRSPCESDCFKS